MVLATDILIFCLFAASLHFMLGQGGLVSFGHAAFFGIGSYATALVLIHLEWPFLACLLVSMGASALLALVIAGLLERAYLTIPAVLYVVVSSAMLLVVIVWVGVTPWDCRARICRLWTIRSSW